MRMEHHRSGNTLRGYWMIEKSNGYLEAYYNACKRGEFIIGIELSLSLENLLSDLSSPEYVYDTTLADRYIDFMEHCVRLTKSPFYNKPMKLMLWQKAWISALFGFKIWDKDMGRWINRFKETLLLIGRKNTKSETSSALCLADLLIGGEGRRIVCASNTYDQSQIVFDAVDTMRMMIDPDSKDTWRNRKGLICLYNDNRVIMMSDRTKAKEGLNIDLAVIDEVHEMKDNSLVKPIEQSMSTKEEGLMILITTEGFVNDGYLDGKLKEYRAIINGEATTVSAKRKLPWLYTQDSEQEVWNVNEDGINPAWQKSNPSLVYGIKKWSFLRDGVDAAQVSKEDRAYVLSKDFNFKVANATAWLLRDDYDYQETFDIEEFKGSYCIGAVDLSETTDMTSAKIMLLKKGDRRKYILSHYWIPEKKLELSDDAGAGAKYVEWAQAGLLTITEGNSIDLSLVADWFYYNLMQKHGITLLYCGYDQRFKTDWINKMEYYGWLDKKELVMVQQSPEVLSTPIKQVEVDLKDRFIVGLNDVDKWCLGNAALKVDSRGKGLLTKIDGQASRRIDGAVTLVILQEMYNRHGTDLKDYLP